MKILNGIVLTVTIIGAVNWGLVGLLDFNLVDFLFGTGSVFSRAIYIIVGSCGLYMLSFYMKLSDDV